MVRWLVSRSIYVKKDRNGPLSAKQGLLKSSSDSTMLFALFRCTQPPPPVPPFCSHSPKGINLMKLKVLQCHMESLGRKELNLFGSRIRMFS